MQKKSNFSVNLKPKTGKKFKNMKLIKPPSFLARIKSKKRTQTSNEMTREETKVQNDDENQSISDEEYYV